MKARDVFARGARVRRAPVAPARLASQSNAGVERLTGLKPRAPLSAEIASLEPGALLSKLAMPTWGRRR